MAGHKSSAMKKIILIRILIIANTFIFLSCNKPIPPEPEPNPNDTTRVNEAPSANSGPDQTTFLPKDSVVLDGTASMDVDGTISNFQWTKISGPSSYEIIDSTAEQTTVKSLIEGTYLFELTVTDNEGATGKDAVQIFVLKNTSVGCNGSYPTFNVSMNLIGNLSDPRRPSVAAAGSKVIFAGGANRIDDNCSSWCNTLPSSAIDIYDVITHTWSTSQLSQPRQGIGAVSCGNKMFFAGGSNFELYFNNGTLYDNVDIYDVSTNVWTVAHLSLPRSYVTAAFLANKVFFAGGTEDGMTGTTRVDIYDVPTNSWSIGELSVPRYFIDAVVDDNKIYFVGGETWDDDLGDVSRIIDIYDASTNSWSTSTLEEPYYAVTDVTVADTNYWIYYWGSNNVKIKNMTTGVIVEGCAPYPLSGTFSINDDIVFPVTYPMGVQGYTGSVIVYNTVTGQWFTGDLNAGISSSAAIAGINNTLYIGGGSLGNYVYTNRVYAINW